MGLFELLQKIVSVLERLGIPYLVTGSVAAMAFGEPRLTNDIDIVAAIDEEHVRDFLVSFPPDEFYVSEEAVRKAIFRREQFNIIHPESGIKIDVIIKQDTPFDESRFKRSHRLYPAESYQANFAAPEDVIIKKMEYYKAGGSEKHLRDIAGILKISAEIVDWDYITKWAERLDLTEVWDTLLEKIGEKL
jgi:3',5'-cyclic AMP phosphodiesterase CpdA